MQSSGITHTILILLILGPGTKNKFTTALTIEDTTSTTTTSAERAQNLRDCLVQCITNYDVCVLDSTQIDKDCLDDLADTCVDDCVDTHTRKR